MSWIVLGILNISLHFIYMAKQIVFAAFQEITISTSLKSYSEQMKTVLKQLGLLPFKILFSYFHAFFLCWTWTKKPF